MTVFDSWSRLHWSVDGNSERDYYQMKSILLFLSHFCNVTTFPEWVFSPRLSFECTADLYFSNQAKYAVFGPFHQRSRRSHVHRYFFHRKTDVHFNDQCNKKNCNLLNIPIVMILATTVFALQIKWMAVCMNFTGMTVHFCLIRVTLMCNTAKLYYL